MKYLLGMDLGTSSLKIVLYDEKFKEIQRVSEAYEMNQPHNGWAEQNPEDWITALDKGVKKILEQSMVNPKDIISIGLTGQMHSLVMLDEKNKVIRPAILWCDQRTSLECEEITEVLGREFLINETANPALPGFTLSKLIWVKKNEPENYKRCRHILLPKDYLRLYLTGEYATDVSDASGMQMLNVKGRTWSIELMEKLDLDPGILPKVYESIEVTGRIQQHITTKLGLDKETLVVAGAGDNAAAAVGCGVVKDKMAFTTIGTSGVVFAHTSKIKIDKKGRVHTFCAAVPGTWHVMGVTQAAGLSLTWFLENFYKDVSEKVIFEELDDILSKVQIGSDKLIYLPYLMGERTPHLDSKCRGAFVGLSAKHKRESMLRAVIEGVTFSLRDCYSVVSELGIEINTMKITGGGSNNKIWSQMIADNYDCDISSTFKDSGTTLGAAILASVGVGLYDNVEEVCKWAVSFKDDYKPNQSNRQVYDKYYKIYKKLYHDLKQTFVELNSL
ncbi:xylulokinase [Clostridium algidicarnis]|uniref:xylulokinase n=1 Tax=Clostridium algidicarnis TaxID=37659 RepID=UPI00311A99CF